MPAPVDYQNLGNKTSIGEVDDDMWIAAVRFSMVPASFFITLVTRVFVLCITFETVTDLYPCSKRDAAFVVITSKTMFKKETVQTLAAVLRQTGIRSRL